LVFLAGHAAPEPPWALVPSRATPPILIFATAIFYMLASLPRGVACARRFNTVGDRIEMFRAALLFGYRLFARRRSVVVDVI